MIQDLTKHCPTGSTVFEPGCGNGYISYLAARLGYCAIATDAWEPQERNELFQRAGVGCFRSNLNDLNPWPRIADGSQSAVLFGEVFEHLLNHPLGIIQQLHRVLVPGGILILTTPNPSTIMNAMRVLLDKHSLWGTDQFATLPKFVQGAVLDKGEIHYREYRSCELQRYLVQAGFRLEEVSFMEGGSTIQDSPIKSIARKIADYSGISRSRLLAPSNYIVAKKQ